MAEWENIGGVAAGGFSIDVLARQPKLLGKWLFGEFLVKIRVRDDAVNPDEIAKEVQRLLAHAARGEGGEASG